MYFKVQILNSAGARLGGPFLVQADSPTGLDDYAKHVLVKGVVGGSDYIHEAVSDPPAAIQLDNPGHIKLGVDISYDADIGKIDWANWRARNPSV